MPYMAAAWAGSARLLLSKRRQQPFCMWNSSKGLLHDSWYYADVACALMTRMTLEMRR